VILARINSLENEIVSALNDFQTKFM
jgi:hypothetical protein